MKILVHFEQCFYHAEEPKFRAWEKVSRVFEAESRDHLLNQFENWDYVPKHLRTLSEKIKSGKKVMLWYRPENNRPEF